MRKLMTVILGFSLGLIASCTPPAGIVAKASKLYIDDPNASTVTIIRKSQYILGGITVKLTLDAEDIAYIGRGDRVDFQVQPGEHYIVVSIRNEDDEVLRLDVKPKKKYYFYYSMDPLFEDRYRTKLKELTQEEYEKELATNNYKLLTAGK
jgi:hypothetical protein